MGRAAAAIAAALLGMASGNTALAGATATAKLVGLDGTPMGTANFRATTHGVLIEVQVKGLAPGPHAVLIHASAACEPKDGFASSGPVFSVDAERLHGYFAKGGPRSGDLPLQFAGTDGVLHASLYTTTFSLGDGTKSLFDRDGASLIVHAASDDYLSQPDGKAGARIACGPILRTTAPGAKRKHT